MAFYLRSSVSPGLCKWDGCDWLAPLRRQPIFSFPKGGFLPVLSLNHVG
jgi:hypothetical protein